jgi:hypothetical protein
MHTFGPFLPLFISDDCFRDRPANDSTCYQDALIDIWLFLLAGFIDVRVSQNFQRIERIGGYPVAIPESVLIFSSGTKGPFPIPFWLRTL